MAATFYIRRFPLTTSSWTGITLPVDCSRVVLENGDGTNSVKIRTNPDDSGTEKTLPAGNELDLWSSRAPFVAGTILCYAQASSGAGPLIVSYIL